MKRKMQIPFATLKISKWKLPRIQDRALACSQVMRLRKRSYNVWRLKLRNALFVGKRLLIKSRTPLKIKRLISKVVEELMNPLLVSPNMKKKRLIKFGTKRISNKSALLRSLELVRLIVFMETIWERRKRSSGLNLQPNSLKLRNPMELLKIWVTASGRFLRMENLF